MVGWDVSAGALETDIIRLKTEGIESADGAGDTLKGLQLSCRASPPNFGLSEGVTIPGSLSADWLTRISQLAAYWTLWSRQKSVNVRKGFGFGTLGVIGGIEYLSTAGLAAEERGYAVHMVYAQVVLALVAEGLVWHIAPDITSCVGAVLVVIGLFFVTETEKNIDKEGSMAANTTWPKPSTTPSDSRSAAQTVLATLSNLGSTGTRQAKEVKMDKHAANGPASIPTPGAPAEQIAGESVAPNTSTWPGNKRSTPLYKDTSTQRVAS
ncbi:hypothetical protein DL95DRAFT_484036 [Leptodontidium sp. 2 PMI_412]|nr:hypothetical protein DL95DRAFT_484036 [Leptodontidium sp. 2 PMI_412]